MEQVTGIERGFFGSQRRNDPGWNRWKTGRPQEGERGKAVDDCLRSDDREDPDNTRALLFCF